MRSAFIVLGSLLVVFAALAQAPRWQPPNCPYGLEPGEGPMRCADPNDPNSVAHHPSAPHISASQASGNLDPCGLITPREAADALGLAAVRKAEHGKGRVTSSGSPSPYLICDYYSPGGGKHLMVEITLPTFWYSVRHMGSGRGVKPVSGIGDEAYIENASIYIRKGANVVDVALVFSGGALADAIADTLVRLGTLVASRMPASKGVPPQP
jgi:hypothetical protein